MSHQIQDDQVTVREEEIDSSDHVLLERLDDYIARIL